MIRCLAMGKPIVTTDLALNRDMPMLLTPWAWTLSHPWKDTVNAKPLGVAIDILDEDHSLEITLRRLCDDASLRKQLGVRARQYWETHHRLEMMAEDYDNLLNKDVATTKTPYSAISGTDNDIQTHASNLLCMFGVTPDILKSKEPV